MRLVGVTVTVMVTVAVVTTGGVIGGGRVEAAAPQGDKQIELSARQAFAAARYDEAIELFAKLYAETLNPIYLRNIGRCHQKKREPDKALDAFHDYLSKGKVSSSERKEIQGYIQEMEQLRDDNAKRSLATPALIPAPAATPPAPPPTNVIEVTPAPNPTLALGASPPPAGADGASLVAQPAPPSDEHHPFYSRWWFWTGVGVLAAGGVAAALLLPGGTTRPPCPLPAGQCL
jgi:hypothetical protein